MILPIFSSYSLTFGNYKGKNLKVVKLDLDDRAYRTKKTNNSDHSLRIRLKKKKKKQR